MTRSGYGLTDVFGKAKRCKRCDLHLYLSKWEEIPVVLSTSKSRIRGFLCVRCITHPSNSDKIFYRSELAIDQYVEAKTVKNCGCLEERNLLLNLIIYGIIFMDRYNMNFIVILMK
jgi:hypothetical protein